MAKTNAEKGNVNQVEIFVDERSKALEVQRKQELFNKFQGARKEHIQSIQKPMKNQSIDNFKDWLNNKLDQNKRKAVSWNAKSQVVSKFTFTKEHELPTSVSQDHIYLEKGYIKVPKNSKKIIKIEGEHDYVIRNLIAEGERKFSSEKKRRELVEIIQLKYGISENNINKILAAPVPKARLEVHDACSDTCYKILKNKEVFMNVISVAEETEIKLKLMSTSKNFCDFAKNFNVSCHEIYSISKKLPAAVNSDELYNRPKQMKLVQKMTFNIDKKRKELYEGSPVLYVPCNHKGKDCDESCPCFRGKNFCEAFCCCSKTCPNRFHGCICKAKCNSKICPCVAATRECIAEQCACKSHCDDDTGCANMNIQRGNTKKIEIKPSEISGYGAFAGEDLHKGDFVVEYTGELISQKEAEKRGKMYDKRKVSYLFNLSLDYSVDGYFIGNESRFINHSNNPNCKPQNIVVHGDKRIAVLAKRNIQAGEELTFNYNYNETQKALYFD